MHSPPLSPEDHAVAEMITDAVMVHINNEPQTGFSVFDIFKPLEHVLDPFFPLSDKQRAKNMYNNRLHGGSIGYQRRRTN